MSVPVQLLALRHDLGDAISHRYTVRQVLGAGAFGTVYRVEETLGTRTVTRACKEMHVLDDPSTDFDERADALRMFQEEAYLLETLRHPNIPAAHFESEPGTWLACPVCGRSFRGVRNCPDHGAPLQVIRERYYLLMDFIEGPDLEEMLVSQNGRPLDEEPVLDWMLQVCDALEVVHRAGFSHRDIKPANIKIQKATQRAMLIDFGLVKPSTVVGGYGTILQRKSTSLGTLGYAPPTLEEQRTPDARTDILALGMTMYRLLTSRDPTEPADLELMRSKPARDFNASISPEVSGIIARMVQPDPNKRYQNVDEVRRALQAARYPVEVTCPHCGQVNRLAGAPGPSTLCSRCGRPLADAPAGVRGGGATRTGTTKLASSAAPPRPPTPPRTNPFEARLKQLQAEMNGAATPIVATNFDARIAEVEKSLKAVTSLATGVPMDGCPNCQKAKLLVAEGNPTGICPLCRGAQLERRALDPVKCPCCHQPALQRGILPPKDLFCPVCREMPLQGESRNRLLGVVSDLWWTCPHCRSEWDEGRHHIAKLMSFQYDPFGVGAARAGQTLPLEEWRRMSGRHDEYIGCSNCGANWDVPSPGAATLIHVGEGGQGAQFKGQTQSLEMWQKIAESLPPDAGTHNCPRCRGEFDVDRGSGTMTLLKFGGARPDWANRWLGVPHPLREWYLHAEGKTDGQPGLLCPQCNCEWDTSAVGNGHHSYRLTLAKPGPLVNYIGASFDLADWQRVARGAPTQEQASQLRRELGQLQAQRAEESNRLNLDAQNRRMGAERELMSLLKQAALEGYIPLLRTGNSAPTQTGSYVALTRHLQHSAIRGGETLRWESSGTFVRYIVNPTQQGWFRDGNGTAMVTDSRVLFALPPESAARAPGNAPLAWQRNLSALREVSLQNVQGSQVVAMTFEGDSLPWGFELAPSIWPLYLDGRAYNLLVTPDDLLTMLRAMIQSG